MSSTLNWLYKHHIQSLTDLIDLGHNSECFRHSTSWFACTNSTFNTARRSCWSRAKLLFFWWPSINCTNSTLNIAHRSNYCRANIPNVSNTQLAVRIAHAIARRPHWSWAKFRVFPTLNRLIQLHEQHTQHRSQTLIISSDNLERLRHSINRANGTLNIDHRSILGEYSTCPTHSIGCANSICSCSQTSLVLSKTPRISDTQPAVSAA